MLVLDVCIDIFFSNFILTGYQPKALSSSDTVQCTPIPFIQRIRTNVHRPTYELTHVVGEVSLCTSHRHVNERTWRECESREPSTLYSHVASTIVVRPMEPSCRQTDRDALTDTTNRQTDK